MSEKRLIKGLDVSMYSGLITTDQWQDAFTRGYRVAVVGAWHGTKENSYARDTINNAWNGGMSSVGIYTVLNASSGSKAIHEAFSACGDQANRVDFLALDVEIDGLTHQIFQDAVNEAKRAGAKCCIYTRESFWKQDLGNPGWGYGIPLWDANYTQGPNLEFPDPYGMWTANDLIGRQYEGSNSRLGINADLNVFDEDWVMSR